MATQSSTSRSQPPSSAVQSTHNTAALVEALECILELWAVRHAHATPAQTSQLLELLDLEFLLRLPRLKGMRRTSIPPLASEIRHTFYRNAARILGWTERRSFGAEIQSLVKQSLWPDSSGCDKPHSRKCMHNATEVNESAQGKRGDVFILPIFFHCILVSFQSIVP